MGADSVRSVLYFHVKVAWKIPALVTYLHDLIASLDDSAGLHGRTVGICRDYLFAVQGRDYLHGVGGRV